MHGTKVFVPGYGATEAGLRSLLISLAANLPGCKTDTVYSQRFGDPSTEPHSPSALDLQAAHVVDVIVAAGEVGDLTLIGHSEGASIAVRTAAWYPGIVNVRRVVLVNPANMYRDFFPLLVLRILAMSACDLFSVGGREYWLNSYGYFRNFRRSLREGLALCGDPILPQVCKGLAARDVEVLVFQDRYDGVFSIRRTRRVAEESGAQYFRLNVRGRRWIWHWMRHNWPATHPDLVLAALNAQGAFN